MNQRGPGPLAEHVLLQLVIFMTKQKYLVFRVDHYLLQKYCRRQCTLLSSTWAKAQNLTPKCKILN